MKVFCDLPYDYKPSVDEPFMNPRQKEYFRRRLLALRDTLQQHALDTLGHLKKDSLHEADETDQAVLEEELYETLALRNREAKLLVKIDEALERLENGTYGFCVETGAPIDLKRLEVRLVATHCVAEKEKLETQHRYGSVSELSLF